jgi:HEPN domain-containing protein
MLRKKSNETDPADWIYLAADRLNAADLLWQHEGLTPSGIELLQEAVERYLKAYLIANGWRLVRTHDLAARGGAASGRDRAFQGFTGLTGHLTRDFFAQHYPGSDWTHIGEDYATLRSRAGELIALIERLIPQYFPSKPPTTTP